jgi:hypothetical protein
VINGVGIWAGPLLGLGYTYALLAASGAPDSLAVTNRVPTQTAEAPSCGSWLVKVKSMPSAIRGSDLTFHGQCTQQAGKTVRLEHASSSTSDDFM